MLIFISMTEMKTDAEIRQEPDPRLLTSHVTVFHSPNLSNLELAICNFFPSRFSELKFYSE